MEPSITWWFVGFRVSGASLARGGFVLNDVISLGWNM